MKSPLSFMNNQKGFFLPYVMFLAALVFIVVTANITIYSNDLRMTAKLMEQIKADSLIQMGYATFKQDLTELDYQKEKVLYGFPYGSVEITYFPYDDDNLHLYIKIRTDKNYSYVITKNIPIVSE